MDNEKKAQQKKKPRPLLPSDTMLPRTLKVIEDPENPGELLLDLGEEFCAELGWQVGDTLEWTDNKDGTWTLTKSK
jgi:hypothetical protein